ncbi:MAG: 2-hydroxy-6-oxonona-2,4-dienedioate hydrolase [Chloroflexota bacterium]|jgi:pimeloyl-ACP methyl ester carboxylesterase|nr:2-hydroxy-6-oxonona-2,4-dienedioate hydrolase [Chloroflexota bacterium]
MSTIWTDLLGARVQYLGDRYRSRVIEAGEGEPLLLLHGIGGHAEAYSRNVVRLGRSFRAMAVDFLWHGYSSKPEYVDGEDIPAYAGQLIDLLDAEGIEKAHLEGESLGGWVALWMALHHPERVGSLVLNTTAGIRWKPGTVPEKPHTGRELLAQRSLAAIDAPTHETIRKRLEWLMVSPDRVTDELVDVRVAIYSDPANQPSLRRVFENAFAGTGAPRKTIPEEQLGDVRAPALVLWTDHNPGTGPEVGRTIASRIPGAQFVCMEDAAHWPQWEHPEEHDRIVTSFLSGNRVGQD